MKIARRASILVLLLVALGPGVSAQEEAPEIFGATDEEGNLVIGPDLRALYLSFTEHVRELFRRKIQENMIAGPTHARILLELDLSSERMELVLSDNCILCHTAPNRQIPETLLSRRPLERGAPAHMDIEAFLSSIHFRRRLSCSGCHGGSPGDTEMVDEIYERWPDAEERQEDPSWILPFCGRCHSDPSFMRAFDPGMPTDQVAKYEQSRHGRLLLAEKDRKVATCLSCHGIHSTRAPDNPKSRVYPQNVPATCGSCHADGSYMAGYETDDGEPLPTSQLEEYVESVHGRALLVKGDLSAPACNDCHGNHASMPPEVSRIAQVCRLCHVIQGNLFDASRHKKAFEAHGWPECEICHGKHDLRSRSDASVGARPGILCYECHVEFAPENPECNRVAAHFRDTLDHLTTKLHDFQEVSEELAKKGLDVEPLETVIQRLENSIFQTRTRVHSFARGPFDEAAAEGHEAIEEADDFIEAARAEYRWRRNGMLVAVLLMALLAALLYVKIRQIDRSQAESGSG